MISIILPTYNEKKNISILIPLLDKLLQKSVLKWEIVIVDDNSPDGTADEVKLLAKKYGNIKLVVRPRQEGIGSALREGYNLAKGDIIISMDSDLSFDMNIILDLIKKIEEGYDVVIGKKIDYTAQSFKKKVQNLISRIGNKFISLISGVKIHNFTANFRAMKKEVWGVIKTKEKTNVFLFEMIYLSKVCGFKIGEVQVKFKDRVYGKSKIKIFREAPKFLIKSIALTLKSKIKDFY